MSNGQACFPVTAEQGSDGIQHTLNQITKVRLADGREVAIVDWTWRPLYSTIDTLTSWTDLELRAFVYSGGDPITISTNMTVRETASLMHTNVKTPAQMDSQEEMLVYAIQIEMYLMAEGDGAIESDLAVGGLLVSPFNGFPGPMSVLHQQCIGELEVSEKEYQQGSIGRFPTGFGVFGSVSTGSDVQIGQNNNGLPSNEAVEMFPVPVHIGATENYAFILYNPQGTAVVYRDLTGAEIADAVMRLRINLLGLHKRPAG